MPSAREFFLNEAGECLDRMESILSGADSLSMDSQAFHDSCRVLRGSAQMAREDKVHRLAFGLESKAKALAQGRLAWSASLHGELGSALAQLRSLLSGEGVEPTAGSVAAHGVAGGGSPSGEHGMAAGTGAGQGAPDSTLDRVAAVRAALDDAVSILAARPRDRSPLKAILRRQRELQGVPGVDQLAAEIMAGVEDVCRAIAVADRPVSGDWLEFFRQAALLMAETMEPDGTAPSSSGQPARESVSSWRRLRDELLKSPGASAHMGDDAGRSSAHPTEGHGGSESGHQMREPGASGPAADGLSHEVIPVESVLYRGEAALRRALELESLLEAEVSPDSRAAELQEELFDLIRLGLS